MNKLRTMSIFVIFTMLFTVANASPALAAGITVDQSVVGPSTSLIIGTSQPNELILIAANGWPASGTPPAVTVDGSPAVLITFSASPTGNTGGASVFQFLAPSSGSHTIVVSEGGYFSPYFLNFAVSLLGATNAGLTFTSATFACCTSSNNTMVGSIATSASGQYIFATSTHNTGNSS